MSTEEEDLIWGMFTPQTFLQILAFLPALTLISAQAGPSLDWLSISIGLSGFALLGIIVAKAVLAKRPPTWKLWIMLIAQAAVLAWILFRTEGPLHGYVF